MQTNMSRMISAGVFTAVIAGAATIGYVTGASAQQSLAYPPILPGDDIGFLRTGPLERDLDGSHQDSVTGVFVVRVDGRWVRAQLHKDPPNVRPLGK
jgi:hypothetical protein